MGALDSKKLFLAQVSKVCDNKTRDNPPVKTADFLRSPFRKNPMTVIHIEMEAGAGTISIDDAEPVPFQSAEEVCAVIEQLAGQPDADEAQAFGQATEGMEPPPRIAPANPQMGQRGMGVM